MDPPGNVQVMVLPQKGPYWQKSAYEVISYKLYNSQKIVSTQVVEALTGVGAPMVWATLATLNAAIAP